MLIFKPSMLKYPLFPLYWSAVIIIQLWLYQFALEKENNKTSVNQCTVYCVLHFLSTVQILVNLFYKEISI